jgi:hypothetical protein
MSDRVRQIEHGIVLLDLSGVENPDLAVPYVAEARRLIDSQRKGEVLILTDVSNSNFNQAIIDAIRKFAQENKPWAKASAIVGLSPLMRVIYRAVVAFTGREIRVCSTRQEALSYLSAKATR